MMTFTVVLGLLFVCGALGAPDNRGTEFIIGFMENYQTKFSLELFVTTSRTTNVNVKVTAPKYPSANLNEQFSITAGQVKQLKFTNKLRLIQTEFSSKAVLVEADDEIVIYGVNKETYSNDAFLGLPTDVLGKKYYAICYYPPTRNTEILVVGVEDNTAVTMKLADHSRISFKYGGKTYKKKDTLNVKLNRFDTFQIATYGDLTGTYITADKKISVFSGNRKTNVGRGGSQDHLVEHLTPVDVWGMNFATVPTPDRTTGDYFRFIASEDDTKVKVDGQIKGKAFKQDIKISKAGQFVQKHYDSKLYSHVTADKPILLVQYVLSQQSSREPSDPAMLIIPPIEQYGADYSFATPKYSLGSYINYFMFVVKEKEKNGLILDSKAISGVTFNTIPGTDYVGGFVKISEGSHTVRHQSPISVFGGYLFGRARAESYGFTTGMRLAPINVPCVKTKTVTGDGIDNDCDGLIDEELCTVENKKKDDDGDGVSEEDCAKPPPIDGKWASWLAWGSCSITCKSGKTTKGTKLRTRTCSDPAPAYDGKQCPGSKSESASCSTTKDCPVHGGWNNWGRWGSCSVTCGSGIETRSRSCTNPKPAHGGAPCSGSSTLTRTCTKSSCPIDGGFTPWSAWGTCNKSCGKGKQESKRSCTNPAPQHGGKKCKGDTTKSQDCNTHHCPVHGGLTSWSSWGSCSVSCGGGTKSSSRSCTNPAPKYNGNACVGSTSKSTSCNTQACPIDGGFTSWSAWGTCSKSCGKGKQESKRSCTNPAPQHGGKKCKGDTKKSQDCNTHHCPIHGGLTSWSSWGSCSVSCGGGTKSSSRSCTNPAPKYNGNACVGSTSKSTSCNTKACPIDGGFSSWSAWGTCSLTCGTGKQESKRSCTNPAPQHGGKKCKGDTKKSQNCNTHHCPIDGGYTSWSAWDTCSVTCGGGRQSSKRSCTNPAPQYGGASCSGPKTKSRDCNTHFCPIDGGYSVWSSWATCSLTCGGGRQDRTRNCNSPSPQYGGASCVGASSQTQDCNTHNCPIDGKFTTWTSWDTCTLTCGTGRQGRTRSCTNPRPQYGGASCVGVTSQNQDCNTHHCPIDGGYSQWSSWGSCTVTCGGGSQDRSRSCSSPAPQYGGAQCSGASSQTQSCNTHNCPIDGGFTTWTSWDTCTLTCGGGSQGRTRTCTNPSPQYGGADCTGDRSQTQNCNTHNCPIDGRWTTWTSWDTCTVTCGGGNQGRTRSCTNPAPQYGGANCVGASSENQACNQQTCIIDGSWSAWGTWGACSVTCGGGKYSRSRTCSDPYPQNGGLPCSGDSSNFGDCNTQACPTAAAGAYVQLCPTGWFTCQSGSISCIDQSFVCDCANDCDDGSDESISYATCNPQLLAACPSAAYATVPLSLVGMLIGLITAILVNTLSN